MRKIQTKIKKYKVTCLLNKSKNFKEESNWFNIFYCSSIDELVSIWVRHQQLSNLPRKFIKKPDSTYELIVEFRGSSLFWPSESIFYRLEQIS